MLQGVTQGLAALYGAFTSIVLAFLLSRGVKRASEAALHDPKKSMMILYLGAVQRFVLLLVLFAIGLAVLKLDPLACLIGFGLAQLTYVIAAKLD
jgi:ATP synthase protein I